MLLCISSLLSHPLTFPFDLRLCTLFVSHPVLYCVNTCLISFMAWQPWWAKISSVSRFRDPTQTHHTQQGFSLDWWSSRPRYPYLTADNTHTRQTSITRAGFEPVIPGSEQPQPTRGRWDQPYRCNYWCIDPDISANVRDSGTVLLDLVSNVSLFARWVACTIDTRSLLYQTCHLNLWHTRGTNFSTTSHGQLI